MKLQILIALCMVAAALGYKSCKSNTECAATECCEKNPTRYNLRRGRCYANQIQEGEECHPSFTGQCGCAEGLECVTEEKMTEMQFAYKTHTCQKIMEGSGDIGSGEEPVIIDTPPVVDTPVVIDTPVDVDTPAVVDTPTVVDTPAVEEY